MLAAENVEYEKCTSEVTTAQKSTEFYRLVSSRKGKCL